VVWWFLVCNLSRSGTLGTSTTDTTRRSSKVFVFTKRSGRHAKVRFYWWPLVVSVLLSVLLTFAIR
jgi:hypothetical protein